MVLPTLQDVINGAHKYFSKIDLKDAYYSVEVHAEARAFLGFVYNKQYF
jgi:hypothetical protein